MIEFGRRLGLRFPDSLGAVRGGRTLVASPGRVDTSTRMLQQLAILKHEAGKLFQSKIYDFIYDLGKFHPT